MDRTGDKEVWQVSRRETRAALGEGVTRAFRYGDTAFRLKATPELIVDVGLMVPTEPG